MKLLSPITQQSARRWILLLFLGCTLATSLPLVTLAEDKPSAPVTSSEAGRLFGMLGELLKFSSQETGLPVRNSVKHHLTSRKEVEVFLKKKLAEDQDAKRMQNSEIVLKKFGLLERDFDLKPFLLSLLTEEIEAYYDPKSRTINLLNWVDPEEQRPVLAHELTHALQDQHTPLEPWMDQSLESTSRNASEDAEHLRRDEMDTAREAITEGQATAVMLDYILKPMGKSLLQNPEVGEAMSEQMNDAEDAPMMAKAPLLLSESMLFPYREGLLFTQSLWADKGREAAFAGALDRPPASTWEIFHPRDYENRRPVPLPMLPNIHPLVDPRYRPYDVGQMGQLDVHILSLLLGGEEAEQDLTPAWDGGLYWAGQLRTAKTASELTSTKSVAFFYLSAWKDEDSAQAFAKLWASTLTRKYTHVEPMEDASQTEDNEKLFNTSEVPVLIAQRGNHVFVAESFEAAQAHQLASLLLDAQGSGEMETAGSTTPDTAPRESLTAPLTRFFSGCGVTKSAVKAARRASRSEQTTRR